MPAMTPATPRARMTPVGIRLRKRMKTLGAVITRIMTGTIPIPTTDASDANVPSTLRADSAIDSPNAPDTAATIRSLAVCERNRMVAAGVPTKNSVLVVVVVVQAQGLIRSAPP